MVKGGRYKPEDFEKVYRKLLMDLPLEPKHNDHPLVNRKPERDLHILCSISICKSDCHKLAGLNSMPIHL